ncbi:MAG: ABC transporter ATP-binding protein [Planctomycetes bacterium]|nr:ABC transporter ATP-binding protein [Planctomycetota bacterium]
MTVILTENLTRSYRLGGEDVHALREVSLTVERGEYVAIMGPSGSGKTTFMNLIGLLDTPTRGRYVLNGREVSGLADAELSDIRNREIGFVFQTFNLMPDASALANVELPLIYGRTPRSERRARATEAIDRVGLARRARHRPVELSGGERQRIAIARALVTRPSVILADEPTGNLDSTTGVEIMKLFAELSAAGNTILLITHEPEIADHARRLVRVRDGRIESDVRR